MSDTLNEARQLLEDLTDPGLSKESVHDYFASLDERNLREQVQGALNEYNSIIRKKVLEEGRIDILATEILGYALEPFHFQILDVEEQTPPDGACLILCFRGAGKSTVGTIVRVIYEILKNPDIRILIASNTQLQSEVFLREIKEHFQSNEKLRSVFGDYVGSKWDSKEILVKGRTITKRESTVTCIGVGGPTASRHYDLIIGDDIVDEENSRTELQRERLRVWYYKSLMPTLEAGGRIFDLGTRWNPRDLYKYKMENTHNLKKLIVKGISDDGSTPWPDRYPLDWMLSKRRELGGPIFETQFQMNTDAMEGKIFKYEDFHWYDTHPSELLIFQGVDLAIKQTEDGDYFAHATIGLHPPTNKRYLIEVTRTRCGFNQQTDHIVKQFHKWDALKVGIESNAYQRAQAEIAAARIGGKNRVVPITTLRDKYTRAIKFAAKCENGDILFNKEKHMDLIEEMIKMPDGEHDDMFDATELAFTLSSTKLRKQREHEPGLI